MPGIYTHNYIFRKAAENIKKGSSRSYLMKSVSVLLSSPEHMKAGLFGAIGPNIFDYIHPFKHDETYGSEISFYLHDSGYLTFVQKMLDMIAGAGDSRNEWASAQRAYLMGYVSHIISDSVLHPYVFYSSGFPESGNPNSARFFRRGNLRFQYNIDNWFIYREGSFSISDYEISSMVPSMKFRGERVVWTSVRTLLLESLRRDNPEIFGLYFKDMGRRIDGSTGRVPGIDRSIRNIHLCYKMKRTTDERKMRLFDRFNESSLTYSDFFVRYPLPKRIDDDALNIHQGRWQYPAFQRGFRYDSVLHLVREAVDKTSAAWELIEGMIYSGKMISAESLGLLNAYTGEKEAHYSDMRIKDPVKLKV